MSNLCPDCGYLIACPSCSERLGKLDQELTEIERRRSMSRPRSSFGEIVVTAVVLITVFATLSVLLGQALDRDYEIEHRQREAHFDGTD